MPSSPTADRRDLVPRRRRRASLLLAAAVASATTLIPAAVAGAEQPAGEPAVGRLMYVVADGDPSGPPLPDGGERAVVRLPDGQTLDVSDAPLPPGADAGDTVAVTVGVDDRATVRAVVDHYELAAATTPRTLLTVTVTWAGAPTTPPSPSTVTQAFASTASWYQTASRSKTTFSMTTGPTVTLSAPYDFCYTDPDVAGGLADGLVRSAGYEPSAYDHVAYILPEDEGCDWWGLAWVGGGGSMYNGHIETDVIVHELGHNLGLGHGDYLECQNTAQTAYVSIQTATLRPSHCYTHPYSDFFSVMGNRSQGMPAAPHLEQLGWLGAGELVTGSLGTSTCLAPLGGNATGNPLAVKLAVPGIGDLYFENRQPVGVDASLATGYWTQYLDWQGVQIHTQINEVNGGSGRLTSHRLAPDPGDLPFSPYDPGDFNQDVVIPPNTVWSVPTSTLKVTVGTPTGGCVPLAITTGSGPTVPAAPTNVTATAGNTSASVAWIPPASTGGSPITGYTVASSPGAKTCTTTTTTCTVTGLTNGTAYTFTVRATNAVGQGPASLASNTVTPAVPATAPGAPTNVLAAVGNASATVGWTAPASTGGSPITGYTVTSSPGAKTCTTATTTCTVTGLTNGTAYTFTVRATNAVGQGPASSASNAVTPTGVTTVPTAPTGVTAVAGNATASVSWTAPASNGGSAITGYTVTSSPGSKTCTTATTTCTVTGLTNGTAHTFTVRATNSIGQGPASAASNAVTPTAPPPPPTGSGFTGVAPKRLLDSRDGTGGYSAPWAADQTRNLTVVGGNTTVDPSATAVVLNVTAVQPQADTVVSVFPAGQTRPNASNLNVPKGDIRPNLVTVKVGAGGKVALWSLQQVHLVADVVGYYSPAGAGRYTGVSPTRILDSRDGTGGFSTPWGTSNVQTRGLWLGNPSTGIPADATAVVLNMTVTGPTAGSVLTVYPGGQAQPTASNLNFTTGQTVANLVTVALPKGHMQDVVMIANLTGRVDVIADVVGYYSPSGGRFEPLAPHRLLDSRSGIGGYSTPWGPAGNRNLAARGGATTVPPAAKAVVINVTGVQPTAGTFVTVWPSGTMPTASTLNLPAGDIRANLAIVRLDDAGYLRLYNLAGNTHLVVDVVGYFT